MSATKSLAFTLTVSSYFVMLVMILVPLLWLCGGFKPSQTSSTPGAPFSIMIPQR